MTEYIAIIGIMQGHNFLDKAGFAGSICFVLLFFLVITKWQKAKTKADKKELQLKMSALYYDAYGELIEQIREKQHDTKNHISAILSMVHTIDNYDDLVRSQKEYCHDIIENSKGTKLLLTTENPLIAGFLFRKLQDAYKCNIEVDYKIAVNKNKYMVPEYGLVEMLGILLDNAIEALADKEDIPKKIRIELINSETYMQIKVANTSKVIAGDEIYNFFQKGFTSKGKDHGIGLKKLKRLVRDEKGEILVLNQEIDSINYIVFDIKLPMKSSL